MSRSRRRRDQDRRGEHKKHSSPETRAWHHTVKTQAWLQSDALARAERPQVVRNDPAPSRPSWLDQVSYARLLKLRRLL